MPHDATRVRELIGHPLIDSDGHLLEPMSLLYDFLTDIIGGKTARRILLAAGRQVSMGDAATGRPRTGWWLTPNNAYDIATAMAPRLRAHRAAELGIDFSIVYPSAGLVLASLSEPEFRLAGVRAVNTMNAELCRDHSRHLTPAALIPMHSPDEAIIELSYATNQLGFKVAMIPPFIPRPVEAYRDDFPRVCWLDSYGLDSAYDYDVVWQKFCESGIAVTSHGAVADCMPFGRGSVSNFVFNHIGAHGFQQENLCKSLVLGGVPVRFPALNFAFLEAGVLWACDLLQALVGHYQRRGPEGIGQLNPSLTDRTRLAELLNDYGGPALASSVPQLAGRRRAAETGVMTDEFHRAGVHSAAKLIQAFDRLYFGCEADDRGVVVALQSGHLFGTRLRPVFGSDIGHWDVPDASAVISESYELVQDFTLSQQHYRDYVLRHAVLLHGQMNPQFFEGTAVADAASAILAEAGLSPHRSAATDQRPDDLAVGTGRA